MDNIYEEVDRICDKIRLANESLADELKHELKEAIHDEILHSCEIEVRREVRETNKQMTVFAFTVILPLGFFLGRFVSGF